MFRNLPANNNSAEQEQTSKATGEDGEAKGEKRKGGSFYSVVMSLRARSSSSLRALPFSF